MKPTRKIVNDIRAHAHGTALWWLGNAGWAIRSDDVLLLIDPVIELNACGDPGLSEEGDRLLHELPLQASELGEGDVDLCLVSHVHRDHLGPRTIPMLDQRTRCRFVVPGSCVDRMRECGVADGRMIEAKHGEKISHKHVSIEPLRALHGYREGAVSSQANFEDCGYLIRDGRWAIFHPGDSVLLQEHLEMERPDVFLTSISDHNLHVHNTALLANLWRPSYVVPMHYDTYDLQAPWALGDPQAILPYLNEDVRAHYVIVAQGEKVSLGE